MPPWSETYTIKTSLRPDYYEVFPVFGDADLRVRASRLPFHLSTQLTPRNIDAYCALFGDGAFAQYLSLSIEERSEMLREVLMAADAAISVAEAVSARARTTFASGVNDQHLFLNQSHSTSTGTVMSTPGVVTLMLDAMRARVTPRRILEIGVGSGFHLFCSSKVFPDAELSGFDINRAASTAARAALEEQVGPGKVDILDDLARSDLPHFDAVYCTAGMSSGAFTRLRKCLAPGTFFIGPRALSESEFQSEPATSWLRLHYKSYSDYAGGSEWTKYLALDGAVVAGERDRASEPFLLYDVEFVPYVEDELEV